MKARLTSDAQPRIYDLLPTTWHIEDSLLYFSRYVSGIIRTLIMCLSHPNNKGDMAMQSTVRESTGSYLAAIAVVVLVALDISYMVHVWG